MSEDRYRRSLRAAVGASAAPYGYTLTIWTSGAVVTHDHGVPSAANAVIFMAGAVLGFIAIGFFAFGDLELKIVPEERRIGGWGSFHVPSVGLAIAAAWLASQLHNSLAWPVTGFLVTCTYLLMLAAQLTLSDTARSS